ncbi:hypothetical protein K502DRAFT_347848 [Neoconidiobolus thromboides FSU 785]|nr:hypothetical protein K502DRAFT_347848 [Neoconidiobolus thromboides FSU 785]
MKVINLITVILVSGIMPGEVQLERRKSFIETHQEHGHLPGGKNNPGFGISLIPQALSILKGQSFLSILDGYNKEADTKEGMQYTEKGPSNSGLLSGLGLSSLLGGII